MNNERGGDDLGTTIQPNKVKDLHETVRNLMKSEIKLKAKDGKILLDKNNPNHVQIYEDKG